MNVADHPNARRISDPCGPVERRAAAPVVWHDVVLVEEAELERARPDGATKMASVHLAAFGRRARTGRRATKRHDVLLESKRDRAATADDPDFDLSSAPGRTSGRAQEMFIEETVPSSIVKMPVAESMLLASPRTLSVDCARTSTDVTPAISHGAMSRPCVPALTIGISVASLRFRAGGYRSRALESGSRAARRAARQCARTSPERWKIHADRLPAIRSGKPMARWPCQ